MKTTVRFGMALDGARWSKKPASLGEITCGPRGLLGFLETHLGLTGEEPAAPDRVNEYRAKIAAANPEWCRASFVLDPWGTAKSLLSVRDELRELGWTADIGGSRRFEALGAIERTGLPLGSSFGDRIAAVLASERKVDAEMTVVDDEADYPPIWRKVLDKFFPNRKHETLPRAKGNPEVVIVTGPNEVMLAHDFVRYLAAKPEENGNVAVIAAGDTTLLDGLLHRAGLPAIGGTDSSAAREALQMLPLWIENMWAPFSPSKFIQLLGIAGSPVPGYVRRELVSALSNAPGIGGEEWNDAWRRIYETIEKFDNPEKAKKRVDELRALFDGERYDPEVAGIPVAELDRRLAILAEFIVPRIAEGAEWQLVMSHIRKFRRLIEGQGSLRRVDVARIIDSIYGVGIPREDASGGVAPYEVVDAPGQLMDDADTVLWWNFTDGGGAGTYWSPAEREAMEKAGLSTDEEARRRRELKCWENAYARAGKRLVCFAPETVGGAESAMHPFGVNLEAKKLQTFRKVADRELFNFETGVWSLADRSVQLVKKPQYGKDSGGMPASLPKNAIKPRSLSVTQLGTLVSCPFRWILEKYVGLRDAEVAQVPDERIAMGLLAHRIVEMLAGESERANRKPELAARRAGELFDKLLPERLAEYLLPENTDKRIRAREQLVGAVGTLFAEIESRGLEIEQAEMPLEAEFDGVKFTGSADMVLKDGDGRRTVFDFKWSRSGKYADSVKEGLSLQLAFYSWVLSDGQFDVKSDYFLFPKSEFVKNIQDNRAAFERVADFYRHRISDINSGRVDWGILEDCTSELYPPLTDEENAQLEACEDDEKRAKMQAAMEATRLPNAYPAECRYCSYGALCGFARCLEAEGNDNSNGKEAE